MLLLVPSDYFKPKQPEEHFAPEADAARDLGVQVCTVDHDALASGDVAAALRRVEDGAGDAVYRGWMVRSETYEAMAHELGSRSVQLRTTPAAFRRAHELPGWYETFFDLTPRSRWLSGEGRDGLAETLAELPAGAAVVKDYVKSMKHEWSEAAFIPDTRDLDAAQTVSARFLELRGDDLVGGLVVRQFEEFAGPEVRTWWIAGECRLVTAHPDTPDAPPPDELDLGRVSRAVDLLDAPFVTVDLARRVDQEWRVIEVGDGQVSDRPISTAASELIGALLA